MSPTELTALAGAIGGLLIAFATYYSTVKSSKTAAAASTVTTWRELSSEYKADRDEARDELAEVDAKYRARIRDLEADYQAQLSAMRARITQLEAEVDALNVQQTGYHRRTPP